MKKAVYNILNGMARKSIAKRCQLNVAIDSKVNFRGMRSQPPAKLSIGHGTIFQGRIVSDRTGSIVSIGCNTFVGPSSIVCAEKVEIGDDVLISWGCTIVDHNSHAVEWSGRSNDVSNWYEGKKNWEHVKIRPVKICDRVWIGFNTIVLSGVTIGKNSVIGCGSIVTRNVEPNTVVAGNPARFIRTIENAI